MKSLSRRARRIQRRQGLRKVPGLNLVSLMDIFTILVFFLLVNASSESDIPSQKVLTLPESTAENTPEQTLRVVITPEDILLQGERVMATADIDSSSGAPAVLAPLEQALQYRQSLATTPDDTLTVVADRSVPYAVVRRVIETSRTLKFERIAFAASQVSDRELSESTEGAVR